MDFDLFEVDDDDEILSSICVDKTVNNDSEFQGKCINSYPMLNCFIKEISLGTNDNNHFSHESFIRNSFIFKDDLNMNENDNEIKLTFYKFSKDCLSVESIANYVVKHARMSIQILLKNLTETIDYIEQSYFEQRKQITLMYHALLSIKNDENMTIDLYENLRNIRKLLNSVISKETLSLICTANSVTGNETESAAYHFLHGLLEWRFLDLFIINKKRKNSLITNETESLNEEFFQQYEIFINDLCILSICWFKKNKLIDIIDINCFSCICVEELWLLLQILSEKHEEELNFWKSFNECIEKIQNNCDVYELKKQDLIIFELWLIRGVFKLEGFKTNGVFEGSTCSRISNNYELLEKLTETFLNNEPKEEQIRIFLCNLIPIIIEWWKPKIDIPMILWEYFYKKINSSFYVAGSAPSTLAISSSTGQGYLEKMKSILNKNSLSSLLTNDVNNISSYTLFIFLLGKIIKKFIKLSQLNQIHKILGRIFVKFNLTKFLTLNEVGIHHLIELFLTLILSSELNDIAFKLRDKLLSITLDKLSTNRQICLTKGHIAFILYFFEQNIDITEYIKKLLEQLKNINNDLTISKILIDGLCDILKLSETYNNGEHIFIDSWFSNYLNTCTSIETERILEIFRDVFEKIKIILTTTDTVISGPSPSIITYGKPIEFFNSLTIHVLPFIKHSLGTTTSLLIPVLAADFCILTQLINDQQQFQKQFKSLLDATNYNRQSTIKFLLAILDSNCASFVDSAVIIQIWLKSLVLLSSNDGDVINLTKKIVYLEEFQNMTNLNVDNLLLAKEPLCTFISAIGKNFQACENFTKKFEISNKFNSYLISFDKWILDKNEKTEISYRFYSFIAIVIFNCAEMIYIRSKITCFFHVAMTRFILPCSVQVGKIPDIKLCQIVYKIWPVVVQGIGKLNFKSDPYITKTLTDLIIKWLPHFKSLKISKPFITCMNSDNDELSSFIFGKLATTYLVSQRRQPHTIALFIVEIFNDVFKVITNNELKLNIFIKSTIYQIFEHLMMTDEIASTHKVLLELLKKILTNVRLLNNQIIRDIITEQIKHIIVKHLSYYTFFCFQLLTQIVDVYSELIEEILPFIEEQIISVEKIRGGGNDNRLRSCFDKLNGAILASNSRNKI